MMKASGVVGNVNKHLVPLVEERLNNKASQDSDRHVSAYIEVRTCNMADLTFRKTQSNG
jgi:hypothetical protein